MLFVYKSLYPYVTRGPDECYYELRLCQTPAVGNLRTMSTDKWATSKSTQLSTKVKLLLLLEDALKLNFEAL